MIGMKHFLRKFLLVWGSIFLYSISKNSWNFLASKIRIAMPLATVFFLVFLSMMALDCNSVGIKSTVSSRTRENMARDLPPPKIPIEKKKKGIQELLAKDSALYDTLLFAGDTHFSWGIADLQKDSGFLSPIEEIISVFEEANFRALNLETSLTDQGSPLPNKTYIFHDNVTNITLLHALRINLAILGNNHSMDMGKKGLIRMLQILKQEGIGTVGAGKDRQEARKPYRFRIGKRRYAIFAFTRIGAKNIYSTASRAGAADRVILQEIEELSKRARVILSIHWGREYFQRPSTQQVLLARKLIRKGASAIIGHHPHIPQAIEVYGKGVIVYSLGNFLFGSRNEHQRDNIISLLDFSKKTGCLARIRILPIKGHYKKRNFSVRPLSSSESRRFWLDYYAMIEKHSPSTAQLLQFQKILGIIPLRRDQASCGH